MPKTKNKRTKELLINFSLLFIVLIFCFLVLEAFFRITYPLSQTKTENLLSDPYLCVKKAPNTKIFSQTPEYSYTVNINSYGLRGEEVKENKRNIVLIGDSFAVGAGANDSQTISYLLNDLIRDQRYQVLNLGGMGGFPAHYLRVFNWSIKTFNPQIAIVTIYTWNDFDNQNKLLYEDNICPLIIKDGRLLKNTGQPKYLFQKLESFLSTKSRLFFVFKTKAARSNTLRSIAKKTGFTSQEPIPYYMRIFQEESDQQVQENFEIIYDILEDFKTLSEQNNIKLLIVLIPTKFQVYPTSWQEFKEGYKLPDDYSPFKPNTLLGEHFENNNFSYVDVLDDIYNTSQEYYYVIDEHTNPQGYNKIAQLIYQKLREEYAIN
ncbi:hypothetical protein GOV04_03805 [Candidatus Woesearchaeota archaeon]|nr:hypothetical protein [Candidatus Woesearchaeota archaeon]